MKNWNVGIWRRFGAALVLALLLTLLPSMAVQAQASMNITGTAVPVETTSTETSPETTASETGETTGTADAATDTVPAETTAPGEAGEDGEDGENGEKGDQGLDTKTIVIIAGGAVLIAAAVVLVLKKKKAKPQVQTMAPTVLETSGSGLALVGVGGTMNGYRISITGDEISFGREVGCMVRFPEGANGISRQHCKLFWYNGALVLMDVGSTYGTFSQRYGKLLPNQPVPVTIGDTFYLATPDNSFIVSED